MAGVGSGEWRAGELVRARDEKKDKKKKAGNRQLQPVRLGADPRG